MSLPTITIRNKQYPEPALERMKRKQIKKLNPILERVKNEDLDAIWELVGLLVPTLTASTVDDLELGECQEVLEKSGIVQFKKGNDAEGDAGESITPGESSASTNS